MPHTHIKKLLVANRGEIAIRILRAASELGITTVAIYTYEDRYSLHRYKADESYSIGTEEDALKPYLNIDEILRVAKENEVDAIHPGYGFLSENVTFARRCQEAGIVFVGPRPEVMAQLGDKVAAKKVAQAVNVPMIPDSQIRLEKLSDAIGEAERIGYPVMMKAAAGGGGRGMRVVKNEEELAKAFFEAKNEAKNAFGDDTVFLEKYLEDPKHLEVQILGDNEGNIVHLFERDCSVQRRFQKVVEIAPSILPDSIRQQLYDYALRIANHVKYNNAGTVEFLVEKGEVYFIEVNPRIQVEHTITEEVTGIDIVRSQILIAAGHLLTHRQILIHSQSEVQCKGFAIQCRITTEDPANDFKPDYGQIIAYRNAGGFGIRLDEGSSYAGVRISPFFDSMLVKVSARGRTLKSAAQRMARTLREFRIRGVKTNIPFLINVMENETFFSGNATVGFITQHPEILKTRVGLDRGTKLIRFLADIQVNGNPDVKNIDKSKNALFRKAVVPDAKQLTTFPYGTKNILENEGREKLIDYIKSEKKLLYTDTTFRDAHQSLLATRVRSYDMLQVAESFAKLHGNDVFSMEVWGGATFDVALRFLHECPWERLQQLRKAIPNVLFQMLIRGSNAVGYAAYPDNLVIKFIEKSWENGMDIFRIFDSLNWLEGMKTSIKAVRDYTGGIAEACICYTGDFLQNPNGKYNLQYYIDLARRLEDEGAHILAIKDMAGLLKPYTAEKLVTALKEHLAIPIHLHTHDTSGMQSAMYLKAMEAGVDIVDVALASVSGLTSQPNFNSMVAAMNGHERGANINLKTLNQFSNYWEVIREYYYPFESELKAGTAEVYDHEIPGGQYSNLLPQARSLGLEEKFETIKDNYAVVNQMFGDIVKVTPSSKVVGDMALFMTSNHLTAEAVLEKGESLAFPESVKQLFRGDLGQPEGGFPPILQKLILKEEVPYTNRPNEHLAPIDFDQAFADFQQKFDKDCSFLDFLSYKMYPKVFEEYHAFKKEYGDVSKLPSQPFFYQMKPNQEILVEIVKGKRLLIRYMYMTEANDEGERDVFFKINGQTRSVHVKDKSIKVAKEVHRKALTPNEIGAPLQGKLAKVLVKEGDKVAKNQALFVVEAMKMETTITAVQAATVSQILLKEGVMLSQDDCVVVLS